LAGREDAAVDFHGKGSPEPVNPISFIIYNQNRVILHDAAPALTLLRKAIHPNPVNRAPPLRILNGIIE
jgi:hypothetical protein